MRHEPFEVLDGGGQQELVAGASEAAQSQADHRENMLGLAEQRFDFLASDAGLGIGVGLHQPTGMIPRSLVGGAGNPALRLPGTTTRLEAADVANTLARRVAIETIGVKPSSALHGFAGRTDVEVARLVVAEVRP